MTVHVAGRVWQRVALLASSGLVLAALPMFLVGGLAVQIRRDLGVDARAVGGAITLAFVVGSVLGPFTGRLVDRIGWRRSVLAGSAAGSLALLGIPSVGDRWSVIVGVLVLGGIGVSLMDPGLASLIAGSVERRRHGLVFGLKEAAIPAASLLVGAAIPTLAVEVGWRIAFVVGVLPLVAVMFALWSIGSVASTFSTTSEERVEGVPVDGRIWALAVGGGLSAGGASGVVVLFPETAVEFGMGESGAGTALAVGAAFGVVARVISGIAADRSDRPQIRTIALMMLGGAVTMSVGLVGTPWALVAGLIATFTGGWGWSALFFLSLIRLRPTHPGSAAGIGMAGLGLGNAAGPLLFGATLTDVGARPAWAAAASAVLLGSLITAWSARRVH